MEALGVKVIRVPEAVLDGHLELEGEGVEVEEAQ